jgi:hypothetical protein
LPPTSRRTRRSRLVVSGDSGFVPRRRQRRTVCLPPSALSFCSEAPDDAIPAHQRALPACSPSAPQRRSELTVTWTSSAAPGLSASPQPGQRLLQPGLDLQNKGMVLAPVSAPKCAVCGGERFDAATATCRGGPPPCILRVPFKRAHQMVHVNP